MSIACVIIASRRRHGLIEKAVLPSALAISFDEVLVVGEYKAGPKYRYLHVPDMMKNTSDALIKRDVGALATDAEWIVYLCDDHALSHEFKDWLRVLPIEQFDICVPGRYTMLDGAPVPLNMGLEPTDPNAPYCAGHAGLFRRRLVVERPWTTMPHDRLWDVLSSRIHVANGARLVGTPFQYLVEDLEPQRRPWL